MKKLARVSKPNVPHKSAGSTHYSSEVNAFDTAIDNIIDDYARRLQVPASYVVWEQDSTYYADHCLGTGTDYSGLDAKTVFNNCLTALTSGGKVFVKNGTYEIIDVITISNNNVILDGEGWGTILKIPDTGAAGGMWTVVYASQKSGVGVSNLQIDGNYPGNSLTNKDCVFLNSCNHSFVENVYAHDVADFGILLKTENGTSADVCIRHNYVEDIAAWCGITVWSSTDEATRIRVLDNYVYNCPQDGIRIDAADDCLVLGNESHDNSWAGIKVMGAALRNRVGWNHAYNNTWYGVNLFAATVSRTRVFNNNLHGNGGAEINDDGTSTKIDGVGREASGGGAPTAANWDIGDIVQDTDNPANHWIKNFDGTMRQIA